MKHTTQQQCILVYRYDTYLKQYIVCILYVSSFFFNVIVLFFEFFFSAFDGNSKHTKMYSNRMHAAHNRNRYIFSEFLLQWSPPPAVAVIVEIIWLSEILVFVHPVEKLWEIVMTRSNIIGLRKHEQSFRLVSMRQLLFFFNHSTAINEYQKLKLGLLPYSLDVFIFRSERRLTSTWSRIQHSLPLFTCFYKISFFGITLHGYEYCE